MKLRLKGNEGNSLRLRVSRSEMARLLAGEEVAEDVRLVEAGGLRYTLRAGDVDRVTLSYTPGLATVTVPLARMEAWGSESEVGVYETLSLGDGDTLALVLEKDFACLDRAEADNTDTFEHPPG